MKENKYKLIVISLIILGSVLRLAWLAKIPSGFFRDEAAIGYNAYSIWETGKDEFGQRFPLVFRSFEVFFLPAYVYLSAPFVGILGLSQFSTRLLSSLAGIGALLLAYLIGKEIWNKRTGLLALFILAISPWHIFYSRGAFEGNLALTLFAMGFWIWLKFTKRNKISLFFLATFFFAASMYSYQAQRLVVPAFAIAAFSLALRKLNRIKRKLILPVVAIAIFLIPLLSLSFRAGGYHRSLGVSVFQTNSNPPGWVEGEEVSTLINNKPYLKARQILSLYLSYFSPRNIFIEGDYDKQRSVENNSVYYAWLAPFMLIGLANLFKNRKVGQKLLFAWIILGPLPAALTGDPFHTYRSLLFYYPLALVTGYGMSWSVASVAKKLRPMLLVGVVVVSVISLVAFIFNYMVLTQATRARAWDNGYEEITNLILSLPDSTKVVVDDPWTEGYIHYLFFTRLDPHIYQKEVGRLGLVESYYYTSAAEIRPNKVGNIEFRKVEWPVERGNSGTVFVMTAEGLPESEFRGDPKVRHIKDIYYPDETIAYRVVEIL